MPSFCLTLQAKNNFKQALKERKITPDILTGLKTSEARSKLFEQYVGKENAPQVNAIFEKSILKPNQTDAMIDAAKQVSGLKSETKRGFIEKIKKLDTLLSESESKQYMQDMVSESLGVNLTKENFDVASKYSKVLEAQALKESEFGTPTEEYFRTRKELSDHIDSLKTTSHLRVFTQTIGRGMMLASFKSPFLNIESNSINASLKAIERRIKLRALGGVNNEYGRKYKKFVSAVYLKSGFDVTRMQSIGDERLIRGENVGTTQGKGPVRAVGRVVEDIVFKKLQGYPDVRFAAQAFSDRANIETTKIAGREGLKGDALQKRALEIFKDATRINPKTPEGTDVRDNATADAFYTTYTNKSGYSDFSLAIRGALNKGTGDLRLGDQLMPFVKTPANVIGQAIDSSGTLIPVDVVVRIGKGLNAIRKGENVKTAFGENFEGFSKQVITAGLGITFAYLLSTLFDKDDFIGEYPTTEKERKLLELKQARERSVKIAGKWVSLDYFGVFAAPLVGMLYAKKYGTNLPSTVWQYYSGVLAQAKSLPGLDEFKDVIDALKEIGTSGDSLRERQTQLVNFSIDFMKSRTIPAIISDTARAFDEYERRTDRGIYDKVFAGIPGLRNTLPIKENVFGQPIKKPGVISTYLFGARVKKENTNNVIQELDRLANVGALPSITDVEKTSSRAKSIKLKVGEAKFDSAKTEFGRSMYSRFRETMALQDYKGEDNEGKQKMLNKVKDEEFEKMLLRLGYEAPSKRTDMEKLIDSLR